MIAQHDGGLLWGFRCLQACNRPDTWRWNANAFIFTSVCIFAEIVKWIALVSKLRIPVNVNDTKINCIQRTGQSIDRHVKNWPYAVVTEIRCREFVYIIIVIDKSI